MTNNFNEKIHGLRGLAILSVLLFHFFPLFFKSGFIGVDLFFLISGYLVSNSVMRSLQTGESLKNFLVDFYSKRFARIYPTLLLVVFTSFTLSLLFTSSAKLSRLISDASFAMLGISNIGFFKASSDYFAKSSEFNFFTQTWSLGVEEQFYVVFSVLISLFLVTKSKKILVSSIALICISSLVSVFATSNKSAIFYLLVFRFWEMGLGVILSLYPNLKFKKPLSTRCENLIVLFLSSLFIFSSRKFFPQPYLILFFTLAIILILNSRLKSEKSILNSSMLKFFGDISYSLYLVHWVVLVLMNYVLPHNIFISTLGLFVSILISYFVFSWVEKPSLIFFRNNKSLSIALLIATILLSLTGYSIRNYPRTNLLHVGNLFNNPVKEWGEELLCHGKEDVSRLENPFEFCLKPQTAKKAVFLTGDSHAAQLSFSLEKVFNGEREVRYINFEDKRDVYDFSNDSNFSNTTNEVFEKLIEFSKEGDSVFLTFASYRMDNVSPEVEERASQLWSKYINQLVINKVDVFLVKDSPIFEKSVPVERCIIYRQISLEACDQTYELSLTKRKRQEDFFKKISSAGARTIDLFPYFCNSRVCSMFKNGKLLFFDYHHYTKEASEGLTNILRRQITTQTL